MTLNEIRSNFEGFSEELSKEFYLQGSGLKENISFADIYQKYHGLFNEENLDTIKHQYNAQSGSENSKRRNGMLLEAFYGEVINRNNYELHSQFLEKESARKIKISDSKIISYRSSSVSLINEPSHDKREIIRIEREKYVLYELNPVLKEIFNRENNSICKLGFANKIEMFETFSGFSLKSLQELMRKFLDDTEAVYIKHFSKIAKEKLNMELSDLRPHDLSYLTVQNEFVQYFPDRGMLNLVSSFMDKMGLDTKAGNKIIFDLEQRENKSSRAFCTPVRIPSEVYLVQYPKGGQRDYKTFLHELGHALHYANIDPALEYEYKRLGDNSVTEGFAMTMDHLLMIESWMKKVFNIAIEDNREYFVNTAINELLTLRRFAAKIIYEIYLNEIPGLNGKKEIYKSIFDNALKINYSEANYLEDVDPYFYCARYIRAWMFQANIHKHLAETFGTNWFENPSAGEFLKGLWKLGQKYNADELLKINNCGELSIKPLYDYIINILNN